MREVVTIVSYMRTEAMEGRMPIKAYLATALAAITSMRMGEIRAFCSDQIIPNEGDQWLVRITRAVNDYAGEKTPKGKKTRPNTIPRALAEELLTMAKQNPHEGSTRVFWSEISKDNPIADTYIRKFFTQAVRKAGSKEHVIKSPIDGVIAGISIKADQKLQKKAILLSIHGETDIDLTAPNKCVIVRLQVSEGQSVKQGDSLLNLATGGISEEDQEERNLSFHSLRHTFNSAIRGKIEDKTLRAIVGHESEAMTEHYTHESEEDILVAGAVANEVFAFPFWGVRKAE